MRFLLFAASVLFWIGRAQLSLSESLLALSGGCEDSGNIGHIDWDELMAESDNAPAANISMEVDDDTLTLTVDVEVEYVGYALADDATPGYGMMYVIDFDDYDAAAMDIRETGTCANRPASDTAAENWEDIWKYSVTMDSANDLGGSYPAYWGTDQWNISQTVSGSPCTGVRWTGSWSWYDLMDCADYGDTTNFMEITEDSEWVNMSGAVVVNLVSPLGLNTDTGFYRVYQLASQPFLIAVHKTVNVISSTGIDLFLVTIIAVFKENVESDLEMVVLTESADFLMLTSPSILSEPTTYSLAFGNSGNDISSGCMTSGSLCLQLWSIEADDIECPTDLAGSYSFQFTADCNSAVSGYADAASTCNDYIASNSNSISLSADLEWADNVCDPVLFDVEFSSEIVFYSDDSYGTEMGDDQYSLGQQAFVEVVIGDPSLFAANNVSLDNVWICTTHPDNEPLTVTQDLSSGGCLGGSMDTGFPKHIVQSGVADSSVVKGNVTLYRPFTNNAMRFSFPIEYTVERTELYVHVQSTIDLTPSARRRRLLTDGGSDGETASSTAHFAGSVGITDSPMEEGEGEDLGIVQELENEAEELPNYAVALVAVAATSITCFCCFTALGICYRRKWRRNARNGMDSVSVH